MAINWYQTYLTHQLMESVEAVDAQTVFVDDSSIRSMWEFRLFSLSVLVLTLIVGSAILYLLIRKIMKPFRDLANKVEAINIDTISQHQQELAMTGRSMEMEQLTTAFNKSLDKISSSYEHQRQFSNDVAHELRLPLAIMRSKLDLYQKQSSEDPQASAALFQTMDKSVDRLTQLVEGVLLFSRQVEPKLAWVDLTGLLEEVCFDLEEMAEQKQVELSLELEDCEIQTDDQLLARALYNLIENAIKYNVTNGRVEISLFSRADRVNLTIADTGFGISKEDKKHIFDLFYRVDQSRNSEVEGYGIGLSLTAKILDQLGISIQVTDNDPKGSVFQLTFNLK